MMQSAATVIPFPTPKGKVTALVPVQRSIDLARATRFDVARELLAALETATIPGQHYLMDKVIDLLGGEPFRANSRLTDWQRQTIARSLHELERQAARLVPDESAFVRRAEMLMDVLSLA